MFEPKKSEDSPNATSSRALVDGASPLEWPAGQMTDLFGQEAALVNLSQPHPQTKELRNRMSATFGRPLQGSSASVALQKSTESRLMKLSPQDGWTMPFTIWRRKNTPARRQYCQFTLSRKLLKEADFSLWPTPLTSDCKGSSIGSKKMLNKEISMCRYFLHFHYGMDRPDKTCYPNPRFVAKLMGYPELNICSMASAMQSIRVSPQNLSEQQCEVKS